MSPAKRLPCRGQGCRGVGRAPAHHGQAGASRCRPARAARRVDYALHLPSGRKCPNEPGGARRGNVQRSEQQIPGPGKTHQHSTPGPVREPHRHDHRVLRLLHLRDGRRHRLSAAVLPGGRSRFGHPRLARDLRDRIHGPSGRLGALWPLRRPRRPQDDARRGAAHHGHLDGTDWGVADLRDDRGRRAAHARALPVRPGSRPRRRVGRCRAPRSRECAAGPARLVRHVSAARRADRLLLFGRGVSRAVAMADRRTVLLVRLAHPLSRERRAGASSGSTSG